MNVSQPARLRRNLMLATLEYVLNELDDTSFISKDQIHALYDQQSSTTLESDLAALNVQLLQVIEVTFPGLYRTIHRPGILRLSTSATNEQPKKQYYEDKEVQTDQPPQHHNQQPVCLSSIPLPPPLFPNVPPLNHNYPLFHPLHNGIRPPPPLSILPPGFAWRPPGHLPTPLNAFRGPPPQLAYPPPSFALGPGFSSNKMKFPPPPLEKSMSCLAIVQSRKEEKEESDKVEEKEVKQLEDEVTSRSSDETQETHFLESSRGDTISEKRERRASTIKNHVLEEKLKEIAAAAKPLKAFSFSSIIQKRANTIHSSAGSIEPLESNKEEIIPATGSQETDYGKEVRHLIKNMLLGDSAKTPTLKLMTSVFEKTFLQENGCAAKSRAWWSDLCNKLHKQGFFETNEDGFMEVQGIKLSKKAKLWYFGGKHELWLDD
uniref:HTH OST-type domain-containing protein n=1 Tax=Ditylenchus dipsaci TaxID=166011 RepID=A0A915ESR5_9BILA